MQTSYDSVPVGVLITKQILTPFYVFRIDLFIEYNQESILNYIYYFLIKNWQTWSFL